MILIEVKPRPIHSSHDGHPGCDHTVFDIYVSENGESYVNSSQGYENVEDAISTVRRLWPAIELPVENVAYAPQLGTPEGTVTIPREHVAAIIHLLKAGLEPVVMRVTYRNGKTHTEQLR